MSDYIFDGPVEQVCLRFLVEDCACERAFRAEHGLSVLLELGISGGNKKAKILFDCGQGSLFLDNAALLGVNLDGLSAVVISHGHYDHGGGLPHLGDRLAGVPVYLHPGAFSDRYVERSRGRESIGMGWDAGLLDELGARTVASAEPVFVGPGVVVTGEVPRLPGEAVHLTGMTDSGPDSLLDDQALVLAIGDGLVVLSGCSHSGLVNIIEYARSLTGIDRIRLVAGGFHLLSCSDGEIRATVEKLDRYDIEMMAPCHCTGRRAQVDLLRAYPGRVVCPCPGSSITVTAGGPVSFG